MVVDLVSIDWVLGFERVQIERLVAGGFVKRLIGWVFVE